MYQYSQHSKVQGLNEHFIQFSEMEWAMGYLIPFRASGSIQCVGMDLIVDYILSIYRLYNILLDSVPSFNIELQMNGNPFVLIWPGQYNMYTLSKPEI